MCVHLVLPGAPSPRPLAGYDVMAAAAAASDANHVPTDTRQLVDDAYIATPTLVCGCGCGCAYTCTWQNALAAVLPWWVHAMATRAQKRNVDATSDQQAMHPVPEWFPDRQMPSHIVSCSPHHHYRYHYHYHYHCHHHHHHHHSSTALHVPCSPLSPPQSMYACACVCDM